MKVNPELQETLGLIRAAHLWAHNYKRNYKAQAPLLSEDPHAMESAFLRVEEALTEAMRKAFDELYQPKDQAREQFIKAEMARLERADWQEAISAKFGTKT